MKEPVVSWNLTTHLDIKTPNKSKSTSNVSTRMETSKNNILREIRSTTFPWEHNVSLPRRY